MMLPPLLNVKDFMDSDTANSYDKIALINNAYEIFKKDFIEDGVFFDGTRVNIRNRKLDCSLSDNKCSNDFCSCENCSWKEREDIFQHLTSDYDSNIEQYLTKQARKLVSKRKNSNPNYKVRTPGVFSKSRTIRIPWLKAIIENSDDKDIIKKVVPKRENEFTVKLYHKKEDYLVIITGMKYASGNLEFFLTSAYHNPYPTLLRDFNI